MKGRQLAFLPAPRLEHGGIINSGKRKEARPFDRKRPLHLVLFSTKATGELSMLKTRHKIRIQLLVEKLASKYDLRIYRFTNVGNHLHLLVKARTKGGFQGFLRELTGAIAFAVTGARKGAAKGHFWNGLAYTRIVNWGRDFEGVKAYLVKNLLEAMGAIDRKGRDRELKITLMSSLVRAGVIRPQ